jgi:FkbM family methyltransferase
MENKYEAITPASDGASMSPFIYWVKTFSSLKPENVFEIGANMGQDAAFLMKGFGLQERDIYVFEPHPQLIRHIKKSYKFNSFQLAVFNKNGEAIINAVNPQKNVNSGISSLRVHKDFPEDDFMPVNVESIRMDKFINEHKIKKIDFLKVDVEGCNYEVLSGFGKEISLVNSLHVEAEHIESWEGEKLWPEIRKILEPHFEMVFFERHFTQSDSFWIKREFIRSA